MPRKVTDLDRDHMVERYLAGEGPTAVARATGFTKGQVEHALDIRGIPRRSRQAAALARFDRGDHPRLRTDLPAETIVDQYQAGRSLKSLGHEFGVTQRVITRILGEAGVRLRTPSEARQLIDRTAAGERSAEGVERNVAKVGAFEEAIYRTLVDGGEVAHQQHAVDQRNIDIAIAPVAVEIWLSSSLPFNDPYCRERIEHLAGRGWWCLYILIPRRSRALHLPSVVEHTVMFRQFAQANPAALREHRVIRGTGQLVARAQTNGDPLTVIETSVRDGDPA